MVVANGTFVQDGSHPGPDGRRIAFYVQQDGNFDIYVVNTDGSGLTHLTEGADPAWSPDGQYIALYSSEEIYVMKTDGSGRRRIADGGGAVWSPNSQMIAFEQSGDSIYTVNADGSGLMRIAEGRSPAWSPNSQMIAFEQSGDIYTVNVDGKDMTRLTYHPYPDYAPVWSPDGQHIAFISDRDHAHGFNPVGYSHLGLRRKPCV